MSESYLSFLNEKQLTAVKQPLKPVLVLAGPGTGKTLLLVSRIAWLIEHHEIPAEKILALTFTNKAAQTMQSRLINSLTQNTHDVSCGTFHSFALQLLRKYHSRLGLNKFFSVCDQDYQKHLLQNLCSPYITENLEAKVGSILLSFSNYVMKKKALPQFAKERFDEYRMYLEKHNLIDFDQIILLTRDLMRDNPDIRSEYQFLYCAIVVDEFQDTDPLQYDILKMLCAKQRNIFVVADDDQSIYSWRGANPENIRNFIKDFSISEPIFLEINYRSGHKILNSAQNIIKRTDRIEPNKKLHVSSEKDDIIELIFFPSEKDEIDFIIEKINYWIQIGVSYKEIAIIYPFHKLGHFIEQHIMNNRIPYQMAQGRSLLDHPLIKKIIRYLRLIRNPEDYIALEELTENELGSSLNSYIKHYAKKNTLSYRKALYDIYSGEHHHLNKEAKYKIQKYIAQIANIVNLKTFYNFSQLIDEIISDSNQEDILFINRFAKSLQDPEDAVNVTNNKALNFTDMRVFVYHEQDKIAYVAGALISAVLERPVENIKKLEIKDILLEGILFELMPYGPKNEKLLRVPIYSLASEKRQASLSNLFKYLQWYTSCADQKYINRYVVIDLETTDKDASSCGIVEIAAARVENNKITSEIKSLIKPNRPISRAAQKVHNISEKDVAKSPTIEMFWTEFKSFIDDFILVAHNGYAFDFTILDRIAKMIDGNKLPNLRLDSLTIARNLFPNKLNSIDALMERFKLSSSTRHRASDDVRILVKIFRKLDDLKMKIANRTRLQMHLDLVALGNLLENKITAGEDRIYFITGARKLLTSYAKIRTDFAKEFKLDEDDLIKEIHNRLFRIKPQSDFYRNDEHLINKIKNMAKEYEKIPIDEAIAKFLSYISLYIAQDELEDIDAVSLLTFHAAKGLEFDKVILLGLEKDSMPGFHATREAVDDDRPISQKVEEQRRLFYVGLTRAKTELILTVVKNRGGWERQSSPFLKELNIPYKLTEVK